MSKSLLKIAIAAVVVALIACGALIIARYIPIGNRYANAEEYTAGPATVDGKVKNLDISWIDGAVNLAYHAKDTVEITETAPKAIPEDAALRWWLDGDTLRIQYAKSGYMSLRSLDKVLTVTLPEGLTLDKLAVDATSADVNVPGLSAGDVAMSLTSGDLDLALSEAAKRVTLSDTSGNLRMDLPDAEQVAVSSTSGDILAKLGQSGEWSVSTTSGNITVEADAAKEAALDSTSGRVEVRLTAFDALSVNTTSGNVTVALPTEPGFRAEIDTTSGHIDYKVPLSRDGDDYLCGDGSARLSIDTTSGDVLVTDTDGE